MEQATIGARDGKVWPVDSMEETCASAWIAIGAVIAIGIGIMFPVGSGKPDITHE